MSKEIKFKVAGCQATSSNPNHRTVMVSAYVYREDGELEKEMHLSLFNHDPQDFHKGQELTLIVPDRELNAPETNDDEGTLMVGVSDAPMLMGDDESIPGILEAASALSVASVFSVNDIEPYPLPPMPEIKEDQGDKLLPDISQV